MNPKKYNFIKNPVSGAVLVSVSKLLKLLKVSHLPIKNIPVTEYKDTLAGTFHVVDLRSYSK